MVFFRWEKRRAGDRSGRPMEESDELSRLRREVLKGGLPEYVRDVALKEIEKIQYISESSAEYTIGINYLDYLLSLPWKVTTRDNLDIKRAAEILDENHFGLQEIKDRILEHLAVRILKARRQFRILVVDDERLTCVNIKNFLEREGYEVHIAHSGEEALVLLEKMSFDVVVTDLKMGEVDGLEVLERVKRDTPSTEVIVITGFASVPTAVSAMKKGSFQFLSKPFKMEEIKASVAAALETHLTRYECRGPILCFLGPPGTGKTSLGTSIACSMGRRFVRISLAGVKDEAQIRGHRRSYVGALPGRIIQEIRRVGTRNPVFMLDELDKIGQDFKGDPAAPFLEILDPEQNRHFVDHYLDVPFDLSRVMFIATANTVDTIPPPLLDRLEIIRVPGYTEDEKLQISFNYLIPREVQESGLADFKMKFETEAVIRLIREYTKEAGLRGLQRQISSICRKTARHILEGISGHGEIRIDTERVEQLLGPPRFRPEMVDGDDRIGVCTALAWTPVGGEIMFVESTRMKGGGNLILTGSLGDVLKESAHAALSFLRSNAPLFGIDEDIFSHYDIHVHVPSGAIPKDGPSAGLAIFFSLLSLSLNRACKRDVALSGEITLSGRILPVSGVREKLLAAKNAGVSTVILPEKNQSDFACIPSNIKGGLRVIFVSDPSEVVDEVLKGPQ